MERKRGSRRKQEGEVSAVNSSEESVVGNTEGGRKEIKELEKLISLYEGDEPFPRKGTWARIVFLSGKVFGEGERREEFLDLIRKREYKKAKEMLSERR